jgi:hypothetical protein
MKLGDGHRMYDEGYKWGSGRLQPDLALGAKILGALKMCRSHGAGVGSYAMISIKGHTTPTVKEPKVSGFGRVMVAYLGGTAGATSSSLRSATLHSSTRTTASTGSRTRPTSGGSSSTSSPSITTTLEVSRSGRSPRR